MIKQNIACENMKMHCWMFKEGMYEYMTRLPWEFVRMIRGIGNHVIRRMRCFTRLDGLTSMAKVEWGIRVAQPNFWPVKVLIKPARSLKHQIRGSKTRLVGEKRGKNMMNMSSRMWVKRDWRHLQCGNRISGLATTNTCKSCQPIKKGMYVRQGKHTQGPEGFLCNSG